MIRKRQGKVGNKTLCTRIVLLFVLVALSGAAAIMLTRTKPAFAATDTYPTSIAGCRAVSGVPSGYFTCDLKDSHWDVYFDPWGEENRECTSYAAWMLHSVNGFEMPFNDNANNWGPDAKNKGYTVNMTPAVGSIYWKQPGSGHVAWVEPISPDKSSVTIEDYNHDGNHNWAEYSVSTSSASGYIHFKDINVSRPAAISFKGALNVFRIGGDGKVYQNYWNGTS